MAAAVPKIRSLTCYLIRKRIKTEVEALNSTSGVERFKLKRPLSGLAFVKKPAAAPPAWVTFLREGISGNPTNMKNRSVSAVVFLRASSRLFAFTFGQGRHMLDPSAWEPRFGLRVVLNAVNADSLRSVDARTIEDQTVLTRRQTSRGSPLQVFGLDVTRDLLLGVVGVPSDDAFALRIAGSDALAIHSKLLFEDLPGKCSKSLSYYKATTYKDRFAFIDNLDRVDDKDTVNALDDSVVSRLQRRKTNGIQLTFPEVVDWAELQGVTYSTCGRHRKSNLDSDLDLDRFLESVAKRLSELDAARLKRYKVEAWASEASAPRHAWAVYKCLIADIRHSGARYVLTEGRWFRIGKSLSGRVSSFMTEMPTPGVTLPPIDPGEHEDAYNLRVGGAPGFVCMDRKLVWCEGAQSKVEACDLFTSDRMLIHVKPKTKSSTMSHLFAQGLISGISMFRDARFREEFRSHLQKIAPSWVSKIPKTRIDPRQYTIVFAIVRDNPSRDLPFFTQLNFMQTAQRLYEMGYEVWLVRVGSV